MYLVVGANGFLGTYILKNILEKTEDDIVAVARNIENKNEDSRIKWVSCDITDFTKVDYLCEMLEQYTEIKAVFLAAYHNPDLVEKYPQIAWNTNVTCLSYFVNKLRNVKCLFYPSTDSVYGNSMDGYHFREEDDLNPVNTYGKQKCVAEKVVLGYGYNVVRYPFLIATSLSPVKKHFYDAIVEKLSSGQEMEMFVDSLRSSMSFDTGASLLIDLMENYSEKIPKKLNICGDDDLSKYDIGLMIAKKLGVNSKLIRPASICDSNNIFEAKRAQSTLMDNSKLKETLGIESIRLVL
mgnify:CR=1 FL=1